MTLLVSGYALIVAALFMGLVDAHVRRLRTWDRPRFTLTSAYEALWRPLRRILLGLGLLLVARASILLAAVTGLGLVVLWGWLRWARSSRYTLRSLERELALLESRSPSTSRREMMRELVLARHPEWGPELAEQIVADNSTLAQVALVIARMERGWPG